MSHQARRRRHAGSFRGLVTAAALLVLVACGSQPQPAPAPIEAPTPELSTQIPIQSPAGYAATLTFSGQVPTVAPGEPGNVTVSAVGAPTIDLVNDTEGGRSVDVSSARTPLAVVVLWPLPASLAKYSTITADNCPQCDLSHAFLAVEVFGHVPATYASIASSLELDARQGDTAFFADARGVASLASRDFPQFPDAVRAEVEAVLAQPPLYYLDAAAFGFADGISEPLCEVPGDVSYDTVVVGAVAPTGQALTESEAALTPGTPCFD